MKLLPLLLINASLVAGGIVIYDQVRSDGPSTTYHEGGVDAVAMAELTDRIAALEGGSPTLKASGTNPQILARLEALEKSGAVSVATNESASDTVADGGTAGSGTPGGGMALPDIEEGEAPSADDVRRFRKLQEASDQLRRDERDRERLLATLKELEITLDPKQTNKFISAQRDYRGKIGEMWRKAFSGGRAQGADREAMRETARAGMETLREDFSVTINKFIPSADAQKIIENMNRFGGRGGDMGGMRRGR